MPPENPATAGAWRDARRGDLVEIEGRTVRGGFAPNVQPSLVTKLGTAALPAPKRIPYTSMLTGRHDCELRRNPRRRPARVAVVRSAGADDVRRRRVRGGRHARGVLGSHAGGFDPAHRRARAAARKRRDDFRQHRAAPRRVAVRRPHERCRSARVSAGSVRAADALDPQHVQLLACRRGQPPNPRARRRDGLHPGQADRAAGLHEHRQVSLRPPCVVRARRDRRGAHRDGAAAAHPARDRGRSRRVPGRLAGKTHHHERAVQSGRPGIPARAGDRGRIERHHARERRDARAHAGPAAQPPHEPHAARARRQSRRHRVRRRARARHRHDR